MGGTRSKKRYKAALSPTFTTSPPGVGLSRSCELEGQCPTLKVRELTARRKEMKPRFIRLCLEKAALQRYTQERYPSDRRSTRWQVLQAALESRPNELTKLPRGLLAQSLVLGMMSERGSHRVDMKMRHL